MTRNSVLDAIDCLVEQWHEGDDSRPLHEFLGMSWELYARVTAGTMTAQELQDWADGRGLRIEEDA